MGLSKSKLMQGLQCPKSLWLSFHRPDLIPPTDASTQKQFDEGNEVGQKAREWWGEGLLVEIDFRNKEQSCALTQAAIQKNVTTVFEAAFSTGDLYARVDILHRENSESGWQLIEVKKTTEVKDYHLQDVAVQALILKRSGVQIETYHLMHINRDCVFPHLQDLFVVEDITNEIESILSMIEEQIINLQTVVSEAVEPKKKIGSHCDEPFECQFKKYCWKNVPEESVFTLPRIGKKVWDMVDQGMLKITDLNPQNFSGTVLRAIEVTKSRTRWVDSEGIKCKLENFRFPLYFLDFETIGPAIPRYATTKPYEQIPFQLSCHIWKDEKSSAVSHFEYLHVDGTDPRPGIISTLVNNIGLEGSIVAYNQAFEVGVISRLAEFDEQHRKILLDFIERFVDPLPIFRSHVYDPKFFGSFSIKSVAPAILGEKHSYQTLQIQNGEQAQAAVESLMKNLIPASERENTIQSLLEYCKHDTYLMVELVKWLLAQK